MSVYHVPVLVEAVVGLLADAPPGPIVDGTLGGGGHLAALHARLGADPERRFVGIDKDPEALTAAASRLGDAARTRFVRGDFRALDAHIRTALGDDARVAGILLDLGVSSRQLDAADRGFGIKHGHAGLDMRMGDQGETAAELVARVEHGELARILREYGEVPHAGTLATRLQQARAEGRLDTMADLVRVVDTMRAAFRQLKVHPATLVAQALRIAVNDELGALDDALGLAPDVLVPGGRLVVISYHSLEDRRVKQAFHHGEHGPERPGKLPPPSDWRPTWKTLTKRPVTADEAEVAVNPRARSARLRAAARAPFTARGAA
ncbi:MAG: 16S rRNA (cytosine(1402)-N(4))-methyltransferase RsmH [Deltaproteobacteria bacterium]|nr:16S rRNA (cytosine(1402)-N(4))-methyltransferase RsmH [Deltaproteobacteria bacterium]